MPSSSTVKFGQINKNVSFNHTQNKTHANIYTYLHHFMNLLYINVLLPLTLAISNTYCFFFLILLF